MRRLYDHIDLRVPRLAEAKSFYEVLLPALGFTRKVDVEGWLQFEAGGSDVTEFFGVTESNNDIFIGPFAPSYPFRAIRVTNGSLTSRMLLRPPPLKSSESICAR